MIRKTNPTDRVKKVAFDPPNRTRFSSREENFVSVQNPDLDLSAKRAPNKFTHIYIHTQNKIPILSTTIVSLSLSLYLYLYVETFITILMAVAVEEPFSTLMPLPKPKPLMRVCFSFAAYAKNVVNYLYSSNIPVDAGLSESEFAAVESAFNFVFPPDLRSILQEGLPVGAGFPNWRSSSQQQIEILANLPILGICKEVSRNSFWLDSWGERPPDGDRAAIVAKDFLRNAPLLVPLYRNFYIPSAPCAAGNPVFYVHGGDVRLWSFDIAGFFQRVEFGMGGGGEEVMRRPPAMGAAAANALFPAPAWAATEAREIEFWSELAARDGTRGWWSGELGACLEEVCWRLRDGGWKEEDVREMMMIDGCSCRDQEEAVDGERRVRSMSERLLGAGWSREDVVELLGFPHDFDRSGGDDGDYCFDFRRRESCDDKKHNTISLTF